MNLFKVIKKNAKLYIILSVIVLLGTLGISFALIAGGFTPIDVNTTALGINANISYDTDSNGAEVVNDGNLLPINDTLVTGPDVTDTRILKVKFNVSGVSGNPANSIYDIALRDADIDCNLRTKDLKWRLYKGTTLINEGNLSPAFDTMTNNRMVLTKTQEDLTTNVDSYTFLLWISESCTGDITECDSSLDQSMYLNKTLKFSIKVELATGSKKTLVRTTAKEDSCFYDPVDIPMCNNITYNGNTQTLINSGSNYTLENTTGIDAGTYAITARLDDGYKWSSGETNDKVISCDINKKDITVTTLDQTVADYKGNVSSTVDDVSVSGLVSGHSLSQVSLTTNVVSGEGTISINNVRIVDSDSDDMTYNYNIIKNNVGKSYYATPLSDFTYYLGSEYSTVEEITSYDGYTEEEQEIKVSPISLEENEVLLVRYYGESKDVIIPNTYFVHGVSYNVIILSFAEYHDYSSDAETGIFVYNDNIESVSLGEDASFIRSYIEYDDENSVYISNYLDVNSMEYMFMFCSNLINAPEIPNSVTNMNYAFQDCISLVNAPEIPSSVTNMEVTFANCTSLINAPEIPDSVTSLFGTFEGCTSLVNAPEIPDSVTNMQNTFYGCTSLVNAPAIPGSVTNMSSTFAVCTKLVNAPEIPDSVTNMQNTFYGCTSLVTAPAIPDSVTNMSSTFAGCTKLVNAPVIPNSVTTLNGTFYNCTNLTGTVRINSSNVTNVSNIFYKTSKAITVEVPVDSTTYTNISALTTSNGMPSNVTLKTY